MGGNKVGPPARKAQGAGGGVGKTYVGKAGASANGGASSGYGPPGGAVKKSIGGASGGASSAELK